MASGHASVGPPTPALKEHEIAEINLKSSITAFFAAHEE